ncbi:MAG: ATP-dependent helicase, partial [Candidatus Weimeria sp.]
MIDYEKELNREQLEAVRTTEGPVLILAVAGAGKTRTLIYRVAYLIEKGAEPESILLLTFTNKAAKEMKGRAAKMIGDKAQRITACTYHSFCLQMLRNYGSAIGLDGNFTILSSADIPDIISMVKEKLLFDDEENFPEARKIAGIISSSINKNLSIEEVLRDEDEGLLVFKDDITRIADGYKKFKRKRGLLDFDDLLTEYIRLLKSSPKIRELIDDFYKYIMVDEYQDSNCLQDEMLGLMRQKNKNLAVVGDDMQSLYGFRGADVGNILTFSKRWKGCKTITLFKNYRSGQEILDFSNDLVENNLQDGIFKKMEGNHLSGHKPKVVSAGSSETEALYVVSDIKQKLREGAEPSDIAILTRNSRHASDIELLLNEEDIPYKKYGGAKFMEKSYVRDIMALWKCIVNPRDDVAWYRVLMLFSGIAERYSQKISQRAAELGAGILEKHPYKTHFFSEALHEFHREYNRLKKEDFPDVVADTIKWYKGQRIKAIEAEKKAESVKRKEKTDLERDIETLDIFIKNADGHRNLRDFINALSVDPLEETDEGGTVTVSTIHSAKGLEWPVVYVAGCSEERFPNIRYEGEKGEKQLAEELRCMYVAVTRAKDEL